MAFRYIQLKKETPVTPQGGIALLLKQTHNDFMLLLLYYKFRRA